MKITIELNEKELKGLLFGGIKPEKKVKYVPWDGIMDYRSRQIADIVLYNLKTIAATYGLLSVADYKDVLIDKGVVDKKEMCINYKDNVIGWLYDTIRDVEVVKCKDGWTVDLPDPIELN